MNRSTKLLLLDSGAFTVWTQGSKGATIDLDDYISFCEEFPDCSYYVNLDVIPGIPGNKASLTKESVAASCEAGWSNYLRMADRLGQDRVIPVYHQGDPIKWLEKYLNFGVKYIGISPANDRQTSGFRHKAVLPGRSDPMTTKLQWVRSLRDFLFDSAGRPTVKTHGFAVTSYDLMKAMKWHSVDSASWKLAAAWGAIYVPSANDFSREPEQYKVSANFNPKYFKIGHKVSMKLPHRVMEWLEDIRVPVGTFEIKKVKADYSLDRSAKETWFHKESRIVMVPTELGIVNSFEARCIVNAEFMHRAGECLRSNVEHIYFAGALMPYDLEYGLEKRLLSYYHTKNESGKECLRKHCRLVRKARRKK